MKRKFLFNTEDNTKRAISFVVPVDNNIRNKRLITLRGQGHYEVSNIQKIYIDNIMTDRKELELLNESELSKIIGEEEFNKAYNKPEITEKELVKETVKDSKPVEKISENTDPEKTINDGSEEIKNLIINDKKESDLDNINDDNSINEKIKEIPESIIIEPVQEKSIKAKKEPKTTKAKKSKE